MELECRHLYGPLFCVVGGGSEVCSEPQMRSRMKMYYGEWAAELQAQNNLRSLTRPWQLPAHPHSLLSSLNLGTPPTFPLTKSDASFRSSSRSVLGDSLLHQAGMSMASTTVCGGVISAFSIKSRPFKGRRDGGGGNGVCVWCVCV